MKKLISLSIVALAVRAQAAPLPWRVNFQGKLLANSGPQAGRPVNGNVNLVFNIYDAPSGGSLLWGPESQPG
ncbi:MAG: hypothetical protein PHF00_04805, partial [Elusimicrobia bacterium]|nr:hypothetical protein [Elusimicrobiota bacterium]